MVFVACAPLTFAQDGNSHLIVKGEKGPRASAITWEFRTGAESGIWKGEINNNGLRSLVIDVADNTSGIPMDVFHQRIRFAAYDAYPTGTVWTDGVLMNPNSIYQITATPNGPRGSSAIVIDHLTVAQPPIALFSYAVEGATVIVDASASYDPDGDIVSYSWDWGDGTTGTGVVASHTYSATNTYTITLTVTDNMGLTNSTSESVYVELPKMPPIAAFTYTTDQLTVYVDASASSDPDGTIVSYDWSWGDGTSGTGMTASHVYAMAGTYEITLMVTDNDGLTDSATAMVTVARINLKPIASFTYTVVDLTVSVDASGSSDPDGFITTYEWDWGDGATDSGVTASHTYASYGTYTITLTVIDDLGAMDTESKSVRLNAPPVASFTASVDKKTVTVDASGSTDDGMIVSYAWDWGDGTTGTGKIASHVYGAYGTYTITLTVTDDGGLTDSTSRSIDIVNTPPVAAFTVTINVLTVSVDASASTDDGTIVSYAWDWGDGVTGAGKTASHTYAAYGVYTITLTVTDDGGLTGSVSKSIDLANAPPIALFTATVDKMTVSVDASGSYDPDGTIVSYAWDWGDGTTGSGVTATHTYSTYGTKTIKLTVTDNGGASASKTMSVEIINAPPIASFTATVTMRTVSVDASGSYDPDGTIVSYAWDWGDGTTGTGKTATHTYTTVGTKTITLTVTDNGGATATATKTVTIVNTPPTASFEVSVTLRTVSVDASASSDPDGSIVSYSWDWGDGTTGSGKTASHTYTLAGTYTIILTVTDNDGAAASTSKSITIVNQLPTASFTVTVTMRTVSVDASASSDPDGSIVSYSWDWGDGTPAGSGKTATHTYTTVGTKTITLTVTDNEGGRGSTSKDVTIVNTPPTASFTVMVTMRTASVDASASSDPDGTIVSYAWDWGDGTTGTGKTATHTYVSVGTYTIRLTVTDNDGATASTTKSVTITNTAPTASFTVSVNKRTASVDASASSDPDGMIVSYAWDWGDGTTSTGKTATHTYAPAGGTFTIKLTVTDNDGATASTTKSVTIEPNVAPVASFTVSVSDLIVSVDASGSSDSDGSIVSYAWNWGDGTTGTGVTASHTYASGGDYTITLTVTDNEGATGTASQLVSLVSRAPKITVTISNMFEMYRKYLTDTPNYLTDYANLGRWTGVMGVNEWMNLRKPNYQEWMVTYTYPFIMTYNPYSTVTTPVVSMGNQICSWYRMYVDAIYIPGGATGPGMDPQFVPLLSGDNSLPGGWVNITSYSTYLYTQELKDLRYGRHYGNKYYGVPAGVTPLYTTNDGYWHEFQAEMSFSRDACKKFLGMAATGDLEDEFEMNFDLINGMWFDEWMSEGSGGGAFDIYTAYDYPIDIRWLQVILDPVKSNTDPNTLYIRVWAVSWGIDVLLWRYIEAAGLLRNWQAWADDWYLNLTLTPEYMNLTMRSVNGYQLSAATDEGGYTGGAWSLEAMHLDWCGNTATHNTYISPFNPYDPDQHPEVLKFNGMPGTLHYGEWCSYAVAPMEMDLVAGEKWIIKLSTYGPVIGYPPWKSTTDVLDDAKIAEYNAHAVTGTLTIGTGWPADLSKYYDPVTKTLTLVGPIDFPRAVHPDWPDLLAEGTPTIMFNVV